MRRYRLPLVLLAFAAAVLVSLDVEWWMRLGVSALLVGAAASIFMRRFGLSWGGIFGGFRRDR